RVYHTHRYYKHSAPLEPGLSYPPLLQTFGSAGAGSIIPTVTTNIRLPLEPGPTYAADLLLLTCNLQLATSHRPGQRAAAAVTARPGDPNLQLATCNANRQTVEESGEGGSQDYDGDDAALQMG